MNQTRTFIAVIALLFALTTITAASLQQSRRQGEQAPVGPRSPHVVGQQPFTHEELHPEGTIDVIFSVPMNRQSVEEALSTAPRFGYTLSWPNEQTVRLHPRRALRQGTAYTISVGPNALSSTGYRLAEETAVRVTTVGTLTATNMIPAHESTQVNPGSTITVFFNRPVVPLSVEPLAEGVPHPLRFQPDIPGAGEWINTSIYRWTPSEPLQTNQRYTVRVDRGLVSANGAPLEDHGPWTFQADTIRVVAIEPTVQREVDAGWWWYSPDEPQPALPETGVLVRFNHPVERASAERAFALRGDRRVRGGSFSWNDDSTEMTYTPPDFLNVGTEYQVTISSGVRDAAGRGRLLQDRSAAFETVPYPAVEHGSPEGRVYHAMSSAWIAFNVEMDEDSLTAPGRLTVEPAPAEAPVITADSSYGRGTNLSVSTGFQPGQTYTITLNPGAADLYGNTIDEPYSFTFEIEDPPARFQFNLNDRYGLYDVTQPAQVIATTVNIDSADLVLSEIPADRLEDAIDAPWHNSRYSYQADEVLRRWEFTPGAAPNATQTTVIPISESGGVLTPGAYMLTAESLPTPAYEGSTRRHVMFVSNVHIVLKSGMDETLAWVTDLPSGQPLEGIPVSYRGEEAITDISGLARFDAPVRSHFYQYQLTFEPLPYAVVDHEGYFGVAVQNWSQGLFASDFGFRTSYANQEWEAYIYTERPLYRPGQDVYYRGVVRARDDMAFSISTDADVTLEVYQPSGGWERKLFTSQAVTLTEFGTFHGSITLPEDAKLGEYDIRLHIEGMGHLDDQSRDWWTPRRSGSFSVEEYRKPQYEINGGAAVDNLFSGDMLNATFDASYFWGGPVADADVQWGVWHFPASFEYTGEGRYSWEDRDRYWHAWQQPGYLSVLGWDNFLMEGSGRTGPEGQFVLSEELDLSDETMPRRVVAQATIEQDGESVSGSAEVMVHGTQHYVGVRTANYFANMNTPQTVEALVVDWNSQPLPNQTVEIELVSVRWTRERVTTRDGFEWRWVTEETAVEAPIVATTDAFGKVQTQVTPPGAGSYKVKATVQDVQGNTHTSGAFVWVFSSGYYNWRGSSLDDHTDIVLDQDSYTPGETARLMITSPFAGEVTALVTIEREDTLFEEVITFSGGVHEYEIPVTGELAPNAYISVVMLSAANAERPYPDFKMGLTEITVEPLEQTLNISLTPSTDALQPGEEVSFDVLVTDYTGRPVEAEVSLALVDAALLALAEEVNGDIVAGFYDHQPLGVRTTIPLLALVDRQIIELLPPAPGGMGGGGPPEAPQPDSEVRDDFRDTAFWQADVVTGADGRATVTLTLPDNLTRWRMDARAVTRDTQVGRTNISVTASKPLMVQAVTPRFLVEGDATTLTALVTNNTEQEIDAVIRMDATGVTYDTDAVQMLRIPAGQSASASWLVSVPRQTEAVDVVFRVEGGGHSDAARPTAGEDSMLPVLRYEGPQEGMFVTVGTAGQISGPGSLTETVYLPEGIDQRGGSLSVQVDPSLAASTLEGLTWLRHYPYECNEQLVSRFLPNTSTLLALRSLDVEDEGLESRLHSQINAGVSRISQRQNDDGGWGWWEGDASNPTVTAYAFHGLVMAERAGHTVPDSVSSQAQTYLERYLRQNVTGIHEQSELNLHVYILYVLTENGSGDSRYADRLFEEQRNMSLYARALLAQTIWLENPTDSRLGAMQADLLDAAIISAAGTHWEEDSLDWRNWNTDIRTTAVVLNAFAHIWPESEINPSVVRWLMEARERQHWPTTQETVWSILGLTEYMLASGELDAAYDWEVLLNAATMTGGQVDAASLLESETLTMPLDALQVGALNELTFSRGGEGGQMYYTAYLTAYQTIDRLEPVSNGVSINRRILNVDGSAVDNGRVGDELTVELTLTVPDTLNYILIEDFIPAGAEILNPDLLTESLTTASAEVEDTTSPWGWGWWHFSHIELHDERVELSAERLPPGTYQLRYQIRLRVPGEYGVLPSLAQEFYMPDVFGRSQGTTFTIAP